jgi:hypothetical protein
MDEEPHWGRGVALRRCYSRVGKKMERGWTGEKGRRCVDPGRCRIDPRPRASIYRLRLHPAQWRLDPPPPRLHLHLSLLNLPPPPSSGAAAPRSATPPLNSPPRRETAPPGREAVPAKGEPEREETRGENASGDVMRGLRRVRCLYIFVIFRGYTVNNECICK